MDGIFLTYHESQWDLLLTNRMLFILDGYESHVTIEMLLKAKNHCINMMSLSYYISHELLSMHISCFKPFKQSFRIYRDAWVRKNIGKKVGKQILVQ